ncbi:unnamed protein product [Ambrosiozyma monospora]|uniref:Unnamed protein product n=1 Tax=Ambrosiozyma monospora TaxID=43982 RepID=A0ACB5SW49_AMBMO|nr:unnamed protein product [Ambrosiozyma monospora]
MACVYPTTRQTFKHPLLIDEDASSRPFQKDPIDSQAVQQLCVSKSFLKYPTDGKDREHSNLLFNENDVSVCLDKNPTSNNVDYPTAAQTVQDALPLIEKNLAAPVHKSKRDFWRELWVHRWFGGVFNNGMNLENKNIPDSDINWDLNCPHPTLKPTRKQVMGEAIDLLRSEGDCDGLFAEEEQELLTLKPFKQRFEEHLPIESMDVQGDDHCDFISQLPAPNPELKILDSIDPLSACPTYGAESVNLPSSCPTCDELYCPTCGAAQFGQEKDAIHVYRKAEIDTIVGDLMEKLRKRFKY